MTDNGLTLHVGQRTKQGQGAANGQGAAAAKAAALEPEELTRLYGTFESVAAARRIPFRRLHKCARPPQPRDQARRLAGPSQRAVFTEGPPGPSASSFA